jgi:type IV secretory pathway ATPase VirB11/archaellum biosynthesis ATPase
MSKEASDGSVRSLLEGVGLGGVYERFRSDGATPGCSCECRFDEETLYVDAGDCDGDLTESSRCRRAVVMALKDRDVDGLVVHSNGLEYHYGSEAVALFTAAGRFVELIGDRNPQLAAGAATDPLQVAAELRTRTGTIADVGQESGLTYVAERFADYESAFAPRVGLTVAYYLVDQSIDGPPKLRDVRELETGSEARIYTRDTGIPMYVLDVVDVMLSDEELDLLTRGYEAIAEGHVEGDRAASRAIENVSDGPVDPLLSGILKKHTRGYGILEDLFADPRVTDVYATSPVTTNPLHVVVDGESMATNVYLTADGAKALASRIRRTSGRAFSRANPTVDATAALENGTGVRIAGVTDPVTDGVAFAFREHADDRFTLPRLVENGTLTPQVAAFLSVAIERNAAALIAGTRGAGKTTLLGTLLYELSPDVRTVVIEDTPELPIDPLQDIGRDVQALRIGTGEGPEISSTDALRTALRLGDGALVVGEIRGEEAQVLYAAMRVGANANAVLGTIHGDGADEVYERVVSDLGVEPSSFAATDLVVTAQIYQTEEGRKRRLSRIEEVRNDGDDVWFESLYEIDEEKARSTGLIERGGSHIVDRLAGPGEAYAEILDEVERRAELMERLADESRTGPEEVAAVYANRG